MINILIGISAIVQRCEHLFNTFAHSSEELTTSLQDLHIQYLLGQVCVECSSCMQPCSKAASARQLECSGSCIAVIQRSALSHPLPLQLSSLPASQNKSLQSACKGKWHSKYSESCVAVSRLSAITHRTGHSPLSNAVHSLWAHNRLHDCLLMIATQQP